MLDQRGRNLGIGTGNCPEISFEILGIPRKSWTEVGLKREKTKKHLLISRQVLEFTWLGDRDSNPDKRSQSHKHYNTIHDQPIDYNRKGTV